MWELAIKKAEHWRIDAFELWHWRTLLRVSWTARRSKQSILKKSVLNIHWKDWWWIWSSNTMNIWCKELTHWKRSWVWGKLEAGGEGDHRGWDGWMASKIPWTWICARSWSWWWTGKPGMLQPMGLQRVRQDWLTELIFCDMSLSGGSVIKNLPSNAGDIGDTGLMPCSRKWQPTPVLYSEESYRQRSLVDYSPWCCKEPDMTERLSKHR